MLEIHTNLSGSERKARVIRAMEDVNLPDPSSMYRSFPHQLSGGQRQRLSIARGLLAADTSTLLLLDEPTSSLDPKTELLVYERLFAAFPDKTIVSTLHRLHLLRFFDYIYYMAEGRIVAEGTLTDLLEKSAGFRSMYQEQVGV